MLRTMLIAAAFATPALAQTPPADAPQLPVCSAKVTDGCVQTAAQEKRAMTGEQADKRDARNGGKWTPDTGSQRRRMPQK